MTMRRLVAGTAATAIVGTLALSRMTVEAATAQANLTVQASVTANCDVEAPNTLDFGDYDPVVTHASANLDASTTIRVRCTRGSSNVWVGLDSGSNASSSQRRLAGGGSEFMDYDLYSDAARTTAWGNAQASGVDYSPASSGWENLTVYGRVPSGQDVAVGSYTDTVVATINF